jgi:hypothetical protein
MHYLMRSTQQKTLNLEIKMKREAAIARRTNNELLEAEEKMAVLEEESRAMKLESFLSGMMGNEEEDAANGGLDGIDLSAMVGDVLGGVDMEHMASNKSIGRMSSNTPANRNSNSLSVSSEMNQSFMMNPNRTKNYSEQSRKELDRMRSEISELTTRLRKVTNDSQNTKKALMAEKDDLKSEMESEKKRILRQAESEKKLYISQMAGKLSGEKSEGGKAIDVGGPEVPVGQRLSLLKTEEKQLLASLRTIRKQLQSVRNDEETSRVDDANNLKADRLQKQVDAYAAEKGRAKSTSGKYSSSLLLTACAVLAYILTDCMCCTGMSLLAGYFFAGGYILTPYRRTILYWNVFPPALVHVGKFQMVRQLRPTDVRPERMEANAMVKALDLGKLLMFTFRRATFLPSFLHLPSFTTCLLSLPSFLHPSSPFSLPSFLPSFLRHLPSFLPSFLPLSPFFLPRHLPSFVNFFPSFLPSVRPSVLPSFLPSFLGHFLSFLRQACGQSQRYCRSGERRGTVHLQRQRPR